MAKLEIEERAWSDPRLKVVARRLKAGRGEVMGWLSGIWHDSQQLGLEAAHGDDIDAWMEVGPKYRAPEIRAALASAGYLEPLEDGSYRIDGNRRRVERIQQRISLAKASADARWSKPKPDASRMPDACAEHTDGNANAMLYNTTSRQVDRETGRQGDRESSRGVPGDGSEPSPLKLEPTPKPKPKLTTPGCLVWESYRAAYQKAYRQDPVRNAKSNALCSQLVSRLGVDDAVAVVRFYLTHRGNWYVQKVHQLEYAIKDAEALVTQMKAGHQVTASSAQQTDKSAATAQAFANTAARLTREREERERAQRGGA